jgi:cardiolipin synthase
MGMVKPGADSSGGSAMCVARLRRTRRSVGPGLGNLGGVRFGDGLLHSKVVLIDEDITVFGTVNMDQRSFYLNLELSLIIYEREINAALGVIVDAYVARSGRLEAETWASRPASHRFLENLLRLAGPVL